MLSASRWNQEKKTKDAIDQSGAAWQNDWFPLVKKYLWGEKKWTSLKITEIWPISDHFLKQKYYCITVLYSTVCVSKNRLGQTVQTGQQTLGHLELFSDYVQWATSNWIHGMLKCQAMVTLTRHHSCMDDPSRHCCLYNKNLNPIRWPLYLFSTSS